MAYGRNANTWSTATVNDVLGLPYVKVYSVQLITGTSAGGVTLSDNTTLVDKIRINLTTTNDSKLVVFREPILFPTGIKVTSLVSGGIVIVQFTSERG